MLNRREYKGSKENSRRAGNSGEERGQWSVLSAVAVNIKTVVSRTVKLRINAGTVYFKLLQIFGSLTSNNDYF